RWGITALITVFELAHLAWEHFHGGIRHHHILDRADLPAISNAWGVVLLPILAWVLSGRFLQRAAASGTTGSVGFILCCSILVGVALSAAFVNGYDAATSYIFLGCILSGFVLPVYRGEYVLGFVLGMTFTFGAVLPTLVALFVFAISLSAHRLVYPALAWALTKVRG
ncbi:MAG: hypothetical protein KGH80_00360, partial [Xanthomonadaceae bacterium]|nr:hypothetical protein [Xanthomonadaceae bacterium]